MYWCWTVHWPINKEVNENAPEPDEIPREIVKMTIEHQTAKYSKTFLIIY